VFLDNNVWNSTFVLEVDLLVRAYRQGLIEVVSNLELLEEMFPTVNRRPGRYEQMRRIHNKLVGYRVIRPIDQRHIREVETGGQLSVADRYLDRAVVKAVRQLLSRPAERDFLIDEVSARKQRRLQRDVEARELTRDTFLTSGFDPHRDIAPRVEAATVRGWVADLLGDNPGGQLRVVPTSEIEMLRVPSIWLLVAYTQARVRRTVGDGRKIKSSDTHDGLHCSTDAYFDLLVTSDTEFIETLSLIDELPFDVMRPLAALQWIEDRVPN
jgi:hypothetical protein